MRQLFLLLALPLALAGCEPQEPPLQQKQLFHFGTRIDLTIAGESEALAAETFARADSQLGQWHRRWHAWEPGELTELNRRLALGEPVRVAPDLAALLERSAGLAEESEQLFNPALGKRLKAWGFQRHDPNAPLPAPEPEAKPLPDMRDLLFPAPDTLQSHNPDMSLDLGGIAKGYALNQLIADWQAHGIRRAMVNLGGDIAVLGSLPGRPWRIGILGGGGEQPIAALNLSDGEMAFSSGDYQRRHDSGGGKLAHHILDPRTGAPSEGNVAATVIGRDGERLQAASKVLMIAGADWRRMAQRMQIDQALIVRPDGGVEVTSALAARLEPLEQGGDDWQIVP